MALVGDLASVDLAQVFQVLTQNQKDGVLEIFRGGHSRALRFRRGAVTLQFDRDCYEERAIEIFRKLGRISEEKLHLAAANRSGSDAALLDVLTEMGILDSGDLLPIFRERMAEEIYDFFAWNEGRFEFHEGAEKLDGSRGEIDERFYFPADGIVMEAARRVDEWERVRQVITDDASVFAPAVDELSPEDELQAAVFREIDGMRSITNITQRVGRSSFEVQKTFYRLIQLGAIAPVPPEEFPERGRMTRESGNAREAAHLYDLAIANNVDMPASCLAAGECWEQSGELALAADRFVTYGDSLVSIGREQEAAASYCHAHALVPTNLDAWKKAILLSLQLQENGGPKNAAPSPHAFADICKEIGQPEIAIEVLNHYVQLNPRDIAAKRSLVSALEIVGDRARQCEFLESIANDLVLQGDPMGAASSLQLILRLQPERRDILVKIRELYHRDERRRAHVRYGSAAFLIVAVLAAFGGYLYSRNEKARVRLAALDIDNVLRVGDFTRARRTVADFCDEFKFTFVVDDARALNEKIDDAERTARRIESERVEIEQKARASRLNEARALAKGATEKVNIGDLGGALTDLRRALAAAPPDWDQASAARSNAADLDRYLTEAAALESKITERLGAGDIPAARTHIAQLLQSYQHSPQGRVARYPMKVQSAPPGATITINGEPYKNADGFEARTPAIIYVAPSKSEHSLRLDLPGFSQATVSIDGSRDAEVNVQLGRAADVIFALQAQPTAPPSIVGDIAYIPLGGSRVAAMGSSETPNWLVSVASSGEMVCSPRVEKSGLFVATTDGVIAKLAYEDGHILWHTRLKSNIRVAPGLCGDGIIVATDDFRVRLFDRTNSSVRKEWKTVSRPTGALAIAEPAIAVGLPDGRIQIFDMNSTRPEEKIIIFGVPVAEMVMMDDVLIATGDDGRIASFEWATGRPLWGTPGGRIASPKPVIVGERVYVERDGRLSAMDIHLGSAQATTDEQYTIEGAIAPEGNLIIAPLRDGSIVAFNAADLSVAWHWPGPGGGALDHVHANSNISTNRSASRKPALIGTSDSICVALVDGKFFRFSTLGSQNPSSRPSQSADSASR